MQKRQHAQLWSQFLEADAKQKAIGREIDPALPENTDTFSSTEAFSNNLRWQQSYQEAQRLYNLQAAAEAEIKKLTAHL